MDLVGTVFDEAAVFFAGVTVVVARVAAAAAIVGTRLFDGDSAGIIIGFAADATDAGVKEVIKAAVAAAVAAALAAVSVAVLVFCWANTPVKDSSATAPPRQAVIGVVAAGTEGIIDSIGLYPPLMA